MLLVRAAFLCLVSVLTLAGCDPLVEEPDPLQTAWLRMVPSPRGGAPDFQVLHFAPDGTLSLHQGPALWQGRYQTQQSGLRVTGPGAGWQKSLSRYAIAEDGRLQLFAGRAPSRTDWQPLPGAPFFATEPDAGQHIPKNLYYLVRTAFFLARARFTEVVPVGLTVDRLGQSRDFSVTVRLANPQDLGAVELRFTPYSVQQRLVRLDDPAARRPIPADFTAVPIALATAREAGLRGLAERLDLIAWDEDRGHPIWQIRTSRGEGWVRASRPANAEFQAQGPESFGADWEAIYARAYTRSKGPPGINALDFYLARTALEPQVLACREQVGRGGPASPVCAYLQRQACEALGFTWNGWGRCDARRG